MHSNLSNLIRTSAIITLLFAGPRFATAYVIQVFGPPGPANYGEFFESDQSPGSDPGCNCIDGGVAVFNGTDLETAYDAWVTSVFTHHGVMQGDFFGEDFDGPGWEHNQVFDSQETNDAPTIVDGVTISNDLPDALADPPDSLPLIHGRAEEPAKADHSPGSAPAIDKLAWEARDEFADDDDEIPEATIDFSVNKTDFLGFYIFDGSKQGTYNLQYTDGTIFSLVAGKTNNQNDDGEGFYRFVGFVNTHPTAQINRFWVTNGGSRYGIDEIEWGRGDRDVPEPGTLWLLTVGGAIILSRNRRRFVA